MISYRCGNLDQAWLSEILRRKFNQVYAISKPVYKHQTTMTKTAYKNFQLLPA